ncbi:hypothetical protein GE21DRAFT_1307870 [Neurospora crassa]|nr:hypothetical protein B8B20.120 [imported] - Neurospora crassa [Neurospora crassa]KHE85256.1 hypothetical protein GE21DRAFT_1307870 [Neurospora crassa]
MISFTPINCHRWPSSIGQNRLAKHRLRSEQQRHDAVQGTVGTNVGRGGRREGSREWGLWRKTSSVQTLSSDNFSQCLQWALARHATHQRNGKREKKPLGDSRDCCRSQ